MRTTAIMNLKGGTAKTVTAINTAADLVRYYDHKVLLIDADSQGNLSEFVASNPEHLDRVPGTSELLKGKTPERLAGTKIPDTMLLPGDDDLMAMDVTAVSAGIANPMVMAEWLETVSDQFDSCIIDCPPAFNAAAVAALMAAHQVVIPVKLDAFGIRGLARILAQIRNMKKVNPDLEIAGVLPTMFYNDQTQRQALHDLRDSLTALGIRCFHQIRYSRPVDTSTFDQKPLIESSPKSGACRDYKLFVRELVGEEAEDYGV